MALLDDFKARFTEIDATLANTLVPIYEPVYPCYYGGDYLVTCDKEAILLLMAHLIVTDPSYTGSGSSASSQAVASKSVGSVSVSYAAGSSGSDLMTWLNSTRYGQLFNMLASNNRGPQFV